MSAARIHTESDIGKKPRRQTYGKQLKKMCRRVGSNHRPEAYESSALTI